MLKCPVVGSRGKALETLAILYFLEESSSTIFALYEEILNEESFTIIERMVFFVGILSAFSVICQ